MRSEVTLVVARHGETNWNRASRIQGCLDTELSDHGLQQIELLGQFLSRHQFDVCYSSDLSRALKTAAAIVEHQNCDIQRDHRLRERDFGVFQGLQVAELEQQFPEHYRRHKDFDPHFNYESGQSRWDKYQQVESFFQDVAQQHRDQRVLAVSHGGSMSLMLHYILGVPLDQDVPFRCGNAEFCVFELEANRWILRLWGYDQHLRHLAEQ